MSSHAGGSRGRAAEEAQPGNAAVRKDVEADVARCDAWLHLVFERMARIREERQTREELQARLAAIARATDASAGDAQPIDELERKLVGLRDQLQQPDLVG